MTYDAQADVLRILFSSAAIEKSDEEKPGIHFDRHLYQPLPVERDDKVRSEPPGLKDSDRRFVEDMRLYCRAEKDGSLIGKEVYLLRNLSGDKGIGFFERRRFFPDFMLWIKDEQSQRIVFIEPHRPKEEYPWFWCEEPPGTDPKGGEEFVGARWNNVHLTLEKKRQSHGE